MNFSSESCNPTIRLLAEETGLSTRSVCTHLDKAEQEGWITKGNGAVGGQGWKRTTYFATNPIEKRVEPPSTPSEQRVEPPSPALFLPDGDIDDNVLNDVPSNIERTSLTPSSTIRPEKLNGSYSPEFERVWGLYPRRTGGNPKKAAWRAFKARLSAGVELNELDEGVQRYAEFCKQTGKVGTGYVKMASTFFGPDEWWKEPWASTDDNGRPDLAVL
jgi:hypothetical protein